MGFNGISMGFSPLQLGISSPNIVIGGVYIREELRKPCGFAVVLTFLQTQDLVPQNPLDGFTMIHRFNG
jgi:hypothetical protein